MQQKQLFKWLVTISIFLCSYHFSSAITITWQGDESADWNTPGNWNTGAVPVAADEVQIPDVSGAGGDDPIMSADNTVRSIRVATGATLTIDAGVDLDIDGDGNALAYLLRVNGKVVNNGTIDIRGTTAGHGLHVTSAGPGEFENKDGARVLVSEVSDDAIRNVGMFTNDGVVAVDNFFGIVGGHGFNNAGAGTLTNHFFVSIDGDFFGTSANDITGEGVRNVGTIDNYGEIESFGAVTRGLRVASSGIFNNHSCSLFQTDEETLIVGGGLFDNMGLFESSFGAANTNNGTFLNNGVLADVTNTLATSADFFCRRSQRCRWSKYGLLYYFR